MKRKNTIFAAVFSLFIILLISCKNNNVYDEMPTGKELTVAYEKLLKQNKLVKDSSASFFDIGASFVIYPDNKVEQNQASVYIIVSQPSKGVYKYLYNMTTDKFDSYQLNSADSLGVLFSHQIFPSFDQLDAVRDSLVRRGEINKPQISNLRFYINQVSTRPEIEVIMEDVDNPDNSQIYISDINNNKL